MRHRRSLWFVSCSCDWSEVAVSEFSAVMALRRHLEPQSARSVRQPSRGGEDRHRQEEPVLHSPINGSHIVSNSYVLCVARYLGAATGRAASVQVDDRSKRSKQAADHN